LDFFKQDERRRWPAQGEWTYEDYRHLPDDGQRYEVIRRVLYANPVPTLLHQYVSSELLWRFQTFVRKRKLGFVLGAPLVGGFRRSGTVKSEEGGP